MSSGPSTILHYLFPQVQEFDHSISERFAVAIDMGTESHGYGHIIMAILVTIFTLFIALRYRSHRAKSTDHGISRNLV